MVSRAAVINAPYSSKKERQNGVGAKHPMGVRVIATRRRSFCAARGALKDLEKRTEIKAL